jgi:hypothetical protein
MRGAARALPAQLHLAAWRGDGETHGAHTQQSSARHATEGGAALVCLLAVR